MGLKLWVAGRVAKAVAFPGVSQAWTMLQAVKWLAGGWRALLWLTFAAWFAWQAHVNGELADQLKAKADAAVAREALVIAQLRAARAEINERVVTVYVDRVRTVQGRTRTIVKEVPIYVPADAPALPAGFRVLHDAAAAGELPDPARVADAPPVAAAAVAETVAGNYGTCHETAAQLTSLQDWVRQQQAVKP